VCLGDFNAVSGTFRIPCDTIVGPFGSGLGNDNTERMLAFCRSNRLRIAGSWFQRKNIHRLSWYSNDGSTKKEIDHILVNTCFRSIQNCRVYRSLEFSSDHYPVVATLKIHIKAKKISTMKSHKKFNVAALRDQSKADLFSSEIGRRLETNTSNDTTPNSESLWKQFREAIISAANEVIPPVQFPRKKWISDDTIKIIEQRRSARLAGNRDLYRLLNGERRRALRHDMQVWADRLADEGEKYLEANKLQDAFSNFRKLKSANSRASCSINDAHGNALTETTQKLERWKNYFSELLNNSSTTLLAPVQSIFIDQALELELNNEEINKAIQRLKSGKLAGICGISPEMV